MRVKGQAWKQARWVGFLMHFEWRRKPSRAMLKKKLKTTMEQGITCLLGHATRVPSWALSSNACCTYQASSSPRFRFLSESAAASVCLYVKMEKKV